MKYLVVVLLSIFINKGCSQENQDDVMLKSITYQAVTRGSDYKCTVDKQKVGVSTSGLETSSSSKDISKNDWGVIKAMVEKLEVSTIDKLEAPSANSSVDRTAIGSLSIRIGETIYESASFDDSNPPKELKPLINKILSLAETVE